MIFKKEDQEKLARRLAQKETAEESELQLIDDTSAKIKKALGNAYTVLE